MDAKPPSDQSSLHYQWYLDECARSELLRVEITVLKRNQKVKPMSKGQKLDKFETAVLKCIAAIIIAVVVASFVAKGIIAFNVT